MPESPKPHKTELASTYFVQEKQSKEELVRLTIQDQMLTRSMGGVLPEQATVFQRVLDIGCGSGSWAIEMAQTYPTSSLIGIDISQRMVSYATEQAREHKVSDRVEFRVMDVLQPLDFPGAFFDLVNLRFGVSFMRTWDWLNVLNELLRVTRSGGVIRLTETEIINRSDSSALTQLDEIFLCALFRSGHLFQEETTGITANLVGLLTQYGCQQIQTRAYALEYRAGTPEGQAYYQDIAHAFQTLRPFLQKWGCTPKEYATIYQQALDDIQQSDFRVIWNLLSAWGKKP